MKTKKLLLWSNLFFLLFVLSCSREEVDIPVNAGFSFEVVGADYSIPVQIAFTNMSTGAQGYQWTFEGGNPSVYDKKEPGTITFTKAGTVRVKLEAWRDGERKEKQITIVLDSALKAQFVLTPEINNFGPTTFTVRNQSSGASQFTWHFEGANKGLVTDRDPAPVEYTEPGTYRVHLEARNERGKVDTASQLVKVLPALSAGFTIEPWDESQDDQAPFRGILRNHTISATQHKWTATGGTITNPADSMPTIYFPGPGTYMVSYEASNGKQSQTVQQTIVVQPNTGLRTFQNVRLGINTAHPTIGSFFSTRLGKVLKAGEVNPSNGADIDLVFFGLSSSFNYNLFVRPDSAQHWTFAPIPLATATKLINVQETCGCGVNFTAADFDAANERSDLDSLTIMFTEGGKKSFSNAPVPRLVLFENAAGRKGVIKIKEFVASGQQSYIVCDIKVQKD